MLKRSKSLVLGSISGKYAEIAAVRKAVRETLVDLRDLMTGFDPDDRPVAEPLCFGVIESGEKFVKHGRPEDLAKMFMLMEEFRETFTDLSDV